MGRRRLERVKECLRAKPAVKHDPLDGTIPAIRTGSYMAWVKRVMWFCCETTTISEGSASETWIACSFMSCGEYSKCANWKAQGTPSELLLLELSLHCFLMRKVRGKCSRYFWICLGGHAALHEQTPRPERKCASEFQWGNPPLHARYRP